MYFAVVNSSKRLSLTGFAKYAVDVNLFWLGASILKHAGFKSVGPVGDVGGKAPDQKEGKKDANIFFYTFFFSKC